MKNLTKDELKDLSKIIYSIVEHSIETRNKLQTEGLITDKETIDEIENKENFLKDIFDDLKWGILKEIIETDLKEPKKEIEMATNNVDTAISQLKDANKLIGILGTLTAVATTIIEAFTLPGNPLKLAGLLTQIEELT